MWTILLLLVSNVFMTLAWYGHLTGKHFLGVKLPDKDSPLWYAVLVSWGIAFVEYCFQVPANRLGKAQFTFAQLKTIQEILTLVVFAAFSVWFLGESLRWNHLVGFALLVVAAAFIYMK